MVSISIMSLHRAIRSDWSNVAPQQRNFWQRLAAGSRGVITPGNFISLLGAILVVYGLWVLTEHHLREGFELVFVGRMADILDGFVADRTKTKSPLGEAIDASTDKILVVCALVILLDHQLLPLFVGICMAIHAAYVSSISIIARRLRVAIHPSRSGKLCGAFEWLCVGFYLLSDVLKQDQSSTTFAHDAALISFGLFVITACLSAAHYTQNLYYKQAVQ